MKTDFVNLPARGTFPLIITNLGGYVLLTKESSYDSAVALVKGITSQTNGLAGALDPAELNRAATEPIWAYSNIQQVKQVFGPMIEEGLVQMKASFVQMQTQG